ncbi:NAD(P)/FAD-dependent oxidoreductase [Cetobacterium sp. 8H]|uniref:NAD(P)/FAD-dependent oxidoreductase n=1 Tax=Cetobacterium sp. 8H TaxID=2759681 RepID=UPI00163C5D34|nr:NAD(P)/FAD-dependent oxidoreductase [Cetobacterium sp. 8H]
MKIIVNNINISIEKDQNLELKKEVVKRGVKEEYIQKIEYSKRSIDSRKKTDIKFVYNIEVTLNKDIDVTGLNVNLPKQIDEPIHKVKEGVKRVAVIGAGPAGLFAALRLCELGIKPIIYERGEKVDDRDKTIDNFIKFSILNPNSNIQFGEGGAGTYSDGKLNTRVKSGYMNTIFLELVANGAQEQILWDYKPHVGTDILKNVVKNLRNKIISLGGEFHFSTLMKDIIILDGKVKGIKIQNLLSPIQIEETELFEDVILAIGHSSRDTYRMLHKNGVFMESKPFAIGARIEHPRVDIDTMQYGKMVNHPNLEAATYSLTYNNKEEERGVFSFCMCPGGVIVNAASQDGGSLVNGMSYSQRDGRFSNSALVVGVKANEFGNDLFSGMEFQDELEKKTYNLVGNYGALYQNTLDFLKGKTTKRKIESSYEMEMKSYDLNGLFPKVISDNMKSAMGYWEKTQRNFISENANLIAPETRTSAPIKITRNEFGKSVNIEGLYPIGEGAGYAGGIISAAIDGLKVVDLAFTTIV